MIRVEDADREALVDFMFAHAPILMFPLTNLTRYGMGGGHPRAISAWVAKDGDTITDVLTISDEGIVFPCCPNGDWQAAAAVVRGREVKGFIGEGQQVAALRHAVGLSRKADLDAVEPSYILDIASMAAPDMSGFRLQPLTDSMRELLIDWRTDYQITTLEAPPAAARTRAESEIDAYIAQDSHRLLLKDGEPVAMTGFNASLPEIVQIGGVYTPPALRSRGFARIALAMHLLEVSVDGVTQAVLSAANAAAARAYVALGFEQTGSFAVALYEDPQIAHG